MKTEYADKNIDLIICSYGGVGTSFLIEFFSKYKNCNDARDVDRLKHVDRPPISFNPNLHSYLKTDIDGFSEILLKKSKKSLFITIKSIFVFLDHIIMNLFVSLIYKLAFYPLENQMVHIQKNLHLLLLYNLQYTKKILQP